MNNLKFYQLNVYVFVKETQFRKLIMRQDQAFNPSQLTLRHTCTFNEYEP